MADGDDDGFWRGPLAVAWREFMEVNCGGHRQADTQASGGAFDQSGLGALAAFQAAQQNAFYQAAAQQGALAAQQAYYSQFAGFGTFTSTCSGSPIFGPQYGLISGSQSLLHSLAQQAYQPEPPPPVENAGISAGEIIGHRVWQVKHGLLQSMAVDSIWAPGEPMVGKPSEGVGVHAFKSKSEALTQYWGQVRQTCFLAVGTVALWGEVIEHEKGYRAEFGKVLSLDMLLGMVWWVRGYHLRKLRERYGV